MKLKPKYLPYIALCMGILGFFTRWWLFAGGVDSKGLIIPSHPANALSYILLLLAFGIFFLALRPLTGKPDYKHLFPKSLPALIGALAGAVGLCIAVLSDSSATPLFSVLGIVAVLGMALGGVLRFFEKRPNVLCHGVVAIYLMLHLISQYKLWSAEPELQEYFFPLLAEIFVMITAYYTACLDSLTGSRKWFVFFNYGSVFLCATALYSENWLFYLALGLWCLTCGCSLKPEREMVLPKNVLYCLNKLKNAGYDAYAVGGCVRDSLMGLVPQDYDLCTDAKPEEIARVFKKHELVRNGEKHGTIGVILEKQVYEITTFRTEGGYSDSRHPDWVEFVTNLADDLARRDFTVNAMAYSPETGYIDLFGGQQDLQQGILRTVGDPEARFREDALRILRGVRFAVRFDLIPETKTLQAMADLAPLMDKLAKERIYAELSKLLPIINAQQMLQFAPVITQAVPSLAETVDFDQCSPHHAYDVYTHTAYVVEALPAELTLRFAGLLHDVGKPEAFSKDADGRGHFYEHAQKGAQTAETELWLLRAPTALRQQVVLLIENHMITLAADKKLLRRQIRKFGLETLQQLLLLQKADFCSKGVSGESETDFAAIDALLQEIIQEDACLSVKDLAVGGNDLLDLGCEAGPQIGACLEHLLVLVQDEKISNEKEPLLTAAKSYFDNKTNY